jgi:hypothetical protein
MKNHSLLYFSIFIGSLVLGYSISTKFYPANLDILPGTVRLVAEGSRTSIDSLDNGQRSILLISATSLQTPNPHLESIWLATYLASDTTIRLLPVYPTGKPSLSDFEQQLDSSFNFVQGNSAQVLTQDFVEVLKKDNYWWSGYVVFDEVAFSRIINDIGGIELNGRPLTGEQAVIGLAKLSDNPQRGFPSQVVVLQSVCHKFQEISPSLDLSQLVTLLPNHIYTDLDSYQLQTEMQSLFSNERKPTCRFPTLEMSQVVK